MAEQAPSSRLNPLDDPATLLGARTRYYKRQLGNFMGETGEKAQEMTARLNTPEGQARARRYGGAAATVAGIAPGALQAFQQQGVVPGLVSTAAGLGTAAAVSPISNLLMRSPSLPLKLAGIGLQAVAPALAQQGTAGIFGQVEEGKKGPSGADVSIPKTPLTPEVPLSDAARQRLQRERDVQYELSRLQTLGQAQLGLDRQAIQDQLNARIQLEKAMLPMAERIMRQQVVNQQALMNTQTANYQMLGRQAGMFQLAGQNISESGATLRTAISQNPYAGSVIQAPSISFG